MKILHVISSFNPEVGGPVEGIRQLRKALTRIGVDAHIVCSDAPDAPWIKDENPSKTHAIGGSKEGVYSYNGDLVPWLRNHAHNYDAVIVNGIWQYHSFAAWRAVAGTKVPYFVFTHGMLDPWFKKAYPLKHLKKWLYWPWAEYRVLRDAKAVIFTCEEERRLARESFWLYKANEAVTSYGTATPPSNGDQLRGQFFEAFPDLKDKKILLFLSRIQEKKGCDLLIEAFAKLSNDYPDHVLVMAGPDQTGWQKDLEVLAKEKGVADKVIWPGMLQGDMKWGAFYAAEAFCLPSHQENFGIVVAEALACGKPVLISNKVNIWREIEDDNCGLVDEDTLDGTVRTLKRWLEFSEDEKAGYTKRAKESFAQRFHIDSAAERLKAIISENILKR